MAKLSNAAASAAADATCALANGGRVRTYSGPVPATTDASLGSAVLLCEHNLSSPAFGAAVNGVATANALTQVGTNNASGTPTFARVFAADLTTVVMQPTAGLSGAELNITPAIESGGTATITSLTYTQPKE